MTSTRPLASVRGVARGTFVEVEGVVQPAPHPRFARTPTALDRPPPVPGEHSREVLDDWGVPEDTAETWLRDGAVADHEGAP